MKRISTDDARKLARAITRIPALMQRDNGGCVSSTATAAGKRQGCVYYLHCLSRGSKTAANRFPSSESGST